MGVIYLKGSRHRVELPPRAKIVISDILGRKKEDNTRKKIEKRLEGKVSKAELYTLLRLLEDRALVLRTKFCTKAGAEYGYTVSEYVLLTKQKSA